ncbi:MAG: hypothetical protein A2512_09745 [Deltaproteobacteria bacterium RIFOXYD12_FULL_56_24]|nr:MAG: hypothetical protein A2512_09745 [Deltaproteobacteria bacterium RIFOXYD12_FULL_56_24]
MKKIRTGCALFFLLLFASCVPADYSGSLADRGESGIGGTGQLADKKTGIGGTGFLAGNDGEVLGIVGRITGFGSILVNGVKVEFKSATPVFLAGRQATSADLSVGQVVEVLAVNSNGTVRAESIAIRPEVVGRISSPAPDKTAFQILGQQVVIGADTILPATWSNGPPAGATVRVGGFRDAQGRIFASRIEEGLPDEADFLIGVVQARSAGGAVVDGLPVTFAGAADDLQVGDIVRIRGEYRQGTLVAQTVERDRPGLFQVRVDRLLVEAVPVVGPGGGFRLGTLPFRVKEMSDLDLDRPQVEGMPLLFMGVMDADGGFNLQRISMGSAISRGAAPAAMGQGRSTGSSSTGKAPVRSPLSGPGAIRRMGR